MHSGNSGFMNEIDNELQLVEALEVGQLRGIAGAHECFESSPNELARPAAEHGLFAKQIRFRFLFESCLDHARTGAANAFRPSQCRFFRETGEVLMNRDQAPRVLNLSVSGVAAREINIIGLGRVTPPIPLGVEPDRVRTLRLLITLDRSQLKPGSQPVIFSLTDPARGETRIVHTVFVSGDQK